MPNWAKALIVAGVLVVLFVVGAIAAGVYWWKQHKDALIGKGMAQITEGREFGKKSDNQECLDESISRYKKEPGFGSAIETELFMSSCLTSSRPTEGFCTDVPKELEFMKSANWRIAQCKLVGLSSDSLCPQLFQPVQKFCEGKLRPLDSR